MCGGLWKPCCKLKLDRDEFYCCSLLITSQPHNLIIHSTLNNLKSFLAPKCGSNFFQVIKKTMRKVRIQFIDCRSNAQKRMDIIDWRKLVRQYQWIKKNSTGVTKWTWTSWHYLTQTLWTYTLCLPQSILPPPSRGQPHQVWRGNLRRWRDIRLSTYIVQAA